MTRRILNLVFAAALVTGAAPVLAQENPKQGGAPGNGGQAGSRPSNGNTTGSAAERPSGGSGGGSASSSSGSASSGGSSNSGSSGSMPSNVTFRDRPSAPERRTDRAVTRSTDRPTGVRQGDRANTASSPSVDASSDQRRAVPAYSRPRDGRVQTGEAVARRFPPATGGGGNILYYPYYDPYYGYGYGSRYGYGYGYSPWYGGYGFGLGYFYDPWGYSYYSPYNYDEYGYGQGGYGRSTYRTYGQGVGQLRLKVKPQQGQVYVDGYYAGEVDSFDGVFQRLSIEAGPHKVEIRAPGYETVVFDVMVTPGETVTYKGELRRIK